MRFAEKRKAERFYGEIPIELSTGKGVTRDCSTEGVYFVTDQDFSVGEKVEFVMCMDHLGGDPLRLRCLGKVLRVEMASKKTGVAVAFFMHEFEQVSDMGGFD